MTDFDTGTDQLLATLSDRVATLTLNRPDARNALSPDLSGGLRRAIAWAAESPEVGAVLLTGAGSAFCSGGDVKAMGASKRPMRAANPDSMRSFRQLRERHHGIAGALTALRKPTIAATAGAGCRLRGMAIALACDLRIAASNCFPHHRLRQHRPVW